LNEEIERFNMPS